MEEQFICDPVPERLGHLASNLLRLSKWVQMTQADDSVIELMHEIAWSMEWTGGMASMKIVDMQREICRWRRTWLIDPDPPVLVKRACQMSHRILELSGLLEDNRGKVVQHRKHPTKGFGLLVNQWREAME